MNDAVLQTVSVSTEQEIKSQIIITAKDILKTLKTGAFPGIDQSVAMQELLQKYVSLLSYNDQKYSDKVQIYEAQDDFRISFDDVTDEGIKSNDIIFELLQNPFIIDVLYSIGLKKIVEKNDLKISEQQIGFLMDRGYLAPITISVKDKENDFICLTSKGWLCFRRRNIAQQIWKSLGYTALFIPDWLATSQIKWRPHTFCRAMIVHEYYRKVFKIQDYIIFSFPDTAQLLFGCKAGADSDVVYTVAAVEKVPFTEEEKNTLVRIATSDIVNEIIILVSEMNFGKSVLESLKLNTDASRKVKICVVEDAYGRAEQC